jgi:hypothetical protein
MIRGMSAIGPKRTLVRAPHMSAFGVKADIEGAFATWYAKSLTATCSSATQEKYHAARRRVLLRCCAVCCGG